MMSSIKLTTPKLVAVLAAVSVVSAGVGAGVAVVTLGVSPIAPGAGTLTGSDVLAIDSQELQYSGNNVTAVNATINNTDSTSHTVDVHVALVNTTSGETVRTATVSGVSVAANSTKTVTATISPEVSVASFNKVEVNVEQTG